MVDDALPVAALVAAEVANHDPLVVVALAVGEPVDHELVDHLAAPVAGQVGGLEVGRHRGHVSATGGEQQRRDHGEERRREPAEAVNHRRPSHR